jgi:molybdopterin-containing oxidoreductase family iron-sulfur binding subunit
MKQKRQPFDLSRARAVAETGGKRFWSSLDELLNEAEFREWMRGEFPAAASLFDDPGRRQFLKLMGASLLLAGLTGCDDKRADRALPYVTQPENSIPGVPRYYATAVLLEGYAQPVLATTYDGRPTKLDGNPDHPATRGKSDIFMQSAVFGLYDPERSKMPARAGAASTWNAFAAELTRWRAGWKARGGEGLRILTGDTTSPTLIRQMQELKVQFPNARWHRHEPAGHANAVAGTRMTFGRPAIPHYQFDRCDAVVSIGHDFLGPGPQQVLHAGQWTQKRGDLAPGNGRQRLHVAECIPGLIGVVATTRQPCDASRLPVYVQALAARFGLPAWQTPALDSQAQKWIELVATELERNRGKSLLCVAPSLPPEHIAAAAVINGRLGNTGATVWYSEPLHSLPEKDETLPALCDAMAAGSVGTLIVIDSDPVYSAPAASEFAKNIAQVKTRIHVGTHFDETARACGWHLPLHHPLESWSDARAVDGTVTILQPAIRPLYASRSVHQFCDMLLGATDPASDAAVRRTWQQAFGNDFDARWAQTLHDGFVAGSAAKPVSLRAKTPIPPPAVPERANMEVDIVFVPDASIWDGRFSNIAWLQELPKPLTKIVWDNIIGISAALASEHGLANGDAVEIGIAKHKVRGAAWIIPGQAAQTISLSLGYGRRAGGEIAKGNGYDAYAVRPVDSPWMTRGTIIKVQSAESIATTQAHHRMEGFDFVREVTTKAPTLRAPEIPKTFYPEWKEGDHAWGMSIDLDRCIGCNACVAACNVENNVLVVGKDQVDRGREMLWLRVDRYYTGDTQNPRSYFQPVPCMHCEKAPCEMGCPVHATVHSPEGINQQVYNRCIGTRTCSSYCPYKVRRFNWYDYRKRDEEDRAAKNPDVTVRSRGVMEKCTYCTQRIQAAHAQADKEGRTLRRDEVVTACQQACPTQAIVFGDLNDPESEVSRRRASGRHYVLLEELGTRPRTTYLARWDDTPDEEEG